MLALAIAGGGALGALARFYLALFVDKLFANLFPAGILLVNLTGCFLIGFLAIYLSAANEQSENLRAFILIGFLGGFTTFSTFSLNTLTLFQSGAYVLAFTNIATSVLGSLLMVTLGSILAQNIVLHS